MARPTQLRVLTLVLLLGAAARAEGQTPSTPLVGVGVMINMEDGSSGGRYLNPGLSGTSPAWDWLAGIHVSRRVAVVFEASFAAAYAKEQSAFTGSTSRTRYERTHRDTTYSGVLHVRVHERLTLVGGVSRIRFETTQRRFREELAPITRTATVEGPFPGEDHNGWSTGAVLGFDFNAFQWKIVAVSPAVRMLIYEHHDPYGESPPHYGYGHYAARVGVRLQTRF